MKLSAPWYILIGGVISHISWISAGIIFPETPEPDELLLAEAVGALCANHEYANEDLETGVCRNFCDIVFLNDPQTDRCQYGYRVRTAELIAVANATRGTSL